MIKIIVTKTELPRQPLMVMRKNKHYKNKLPERSLGPIKNSYKINLEGKEHSLSTKQFRAFRKATRRLYKFIFQSESASEPQLEEEQNVSGHDTKST